MIGRKARPASLDPPENNSVNESGRPERDSARADPPRRCSGFPVDSVTSARVGDRRGAKQERRGNRLHGVSDRSNSVARSEAGSLRGCGCHRPVPTNGRDPARRATVPGGAGGPRTTGGGMVEPVMRRGACGRREATPAARLSPRAATTGPPLPGACRAVPDLVPTPCRSGSGGCRTGAGRRPPAGCRRCGGR
jgi:hypothetical protein